MIVTTPEVIAEQLWLRDERELAIAVLDADADTHRRIMEGATSARHVGLFGRTLDDLLTRSAIEVLSGQRRRPARRRPLPDSHVNGLWDEVGHDRDRRDPDDPIAGLGNFLP